MTCYVDRTTGEVVEERVFGETGLRRLYGTRAGRVLADVVVSHPTVSALYAWTKRLPAAGSVRAFVDELGIDASEAEHALEHYASVAHFFERRLRQGARPVDGAPDHVVAPVDGRVLAFDLDGARVPVKGARVDVDALIGGDASVFAGGSALVFRLAPADYHRVHAPAQGELGMPRRWGRRLHSVHPLATSAGAASFANVRSVRTLATERFGRVEIVLVGALLVGTIKDTRNAGRVERGDELGYFAFGGSTVVVLFEQDRVVLDEDLRVNTARGLETLVKMGTRVASRDEVGTK